MRRSSRCSGQSAGSPQYYTRGRAIAIGIPIPMAVSQPLHCSARWHSGRKVHLLREEKRESSLSTDSRNRLNQPEREMAHNFCEATYIYPSAFPASSTYALIPAVASARITSGADIALIQKTLEKRGWAKPLNSRKTKRTSSQQLQTWKWSLYLAEEHRRYNIRILNQLPAFSIMAAKDRSIGEILSTQCCPVKTSREVYQCF